MTGTRADAALRRVDQGLAQAEAAFAEPQPSVSDLRQRAERIAQGRQQIDAVFAARLDYGRVQTASRRVTLDAKRRVRKAEAEHRRLRRQLFWQLARARYQDVFWALLGVAVVAGLVWTVWLWWAEITALVLPPAPPPQAPQAPVPGAGGVP